MKGTDDTIFRAQAGRQVKAPARQEHFTFQTGAGWRRSGTPRTVALALLLLVAGLLLAGCERLGELERGARTDIDSTSQERNTEAFVSQANGPLSVHEAANLFARHCAVCHGARGGGGVGPALAGNVNLASSSYVVARIQLGGGGMPPFARLLSAKEIGATASFIRSNWENEYGTVSEEQVDLQWNGYRRGAAYGAPVGNR